MEEIVLPRLGVDDCLLNIMLSFKKHKTGGCTLALQDLVFGIFRGKWKRAKKKRPPKEKAEGNSFTRNSLLQADDFEF